MVKQNLYIESTPRFPFRYTNCKNIEIKLQSPCRESPPAFRDHLTHWGRVTHICVSNLTIIGPDNGLSPGRRQAIIWTSAGILLIGPLGTNFSEILIAILTFSVKKMHLKMSSGNWGPFCLGLNELIQWSLYTDFMIFGRMLRVDITIGNNNV